MSKDLILAELKVIRGNDPVIDPEKVIRFAKDPTTALHEKFEWDDGVAGHEYRLWQARQICRVYVTVLDTGDGQQESVRMFVNVGSRSEESERGYRPTEEVLDDAEARRELVLAQLTRLWNIYKSYPLPELKAVGRAIERCRKANEPQMLEAAE
jgi:hypothetical protein